MQKGTDKPKNALTAIGYLCFQTVRVTAAVMLAIYLPVKMTGCIA